MTIEPDRGDSARDYVRAASRALDLPIPPHHLDGVVTFYRLAESMARLVDGFALPPDAEPAPVYLPADPGARR